MVKKIDKYQMVVLGALLVSMGTAVASNKEIIPAPMKDPHYTEVGFFDIHVCNWPNKHCSSWHYSRVMSMKTSPKLSYLHLPGRG